MTEKEWIQIVVAVIAGGAMGAILKAVLDAYQGRIQPIGYRIEFVKIFKDTAGSSLKAQLQITDGVVWKNFHNLYIAKITIANKGNAHIEEFRFGVTLGGADVAIYTEFEMFDRHHSLAQVSRVALRSTAKEIDFVCKPFNRKDKYVFKVFVSIPLDMQEPQDIRLSSSHPIKFVDLNVYENSLIRFINYFGEGILH
jgi:hypothetical protein